MPYFYAGNAVYDCENEYAESTLAAFFGAIGTDNETLTESPFKDAANNDFSPTDKGNIKEGSLPAEIGTGEKCSKKLEKNAKNAIMALLDEKT